MLAFSPAKALPLLLLAEVKAYRISLKPCGPGLGMLGLITPETNGNGRWNSTGIGGTRMDHGGHLHFEGFDFFAQVFGRRPTISPAMKTAMMA